MLLAVPSFLLSPLRLLHLQYLPPPLLLSPSLQKSVSALPLHTKPRGGISGAASTQTGQESSRESGDTVFRFGAAKLMSEEEKSKAKRFNALEEPDMFTFGRSHTRIAPPLKSHPVVWWKTPKKSNRKCRQAARRSLLEVCPKKEEARNGKYGPKNRILLLLLLLLLLLRRRRHWRRRRRQCRSRRQSHMRPTLSPFGCLFGPPAFGGTIPDMDRRRPSASDAVACGPLGGAASWVHDQSAGGVNTRDISDGIEAMEIG